MILDTKTYKGACEKDTNLMADRKKDDAGNENHYQNILLDNRNLQNILR